MDNKSTGLHKKITIKNYYLEWEDKPHKKIQLWKYTHE